MTLGYGRAAATMRDWVDVQKLPAERFRLSSAGDSEHAAMDAAAGG